ncbi:MAG: HAD-IC family P-type ATPase [Methanomicrobiales archaeon]|nr:HAD-IC family P-type ATPase [Methanomicrobiales archaeon]
MVQVKVGDIVPADCTVRDGSVDVDQFMLTGESTAVARSPGDMIYSGSTVYHGNAAGTVTSTGSRTYFGLTVELVRTAKSPGHLEELLFTVVRYLATVDAVLAVLLIGTALWNRADPLPLIPFVVVLVIATIPVSMPASFTVANAQEARTLGKEGVLVTGLVAIQEAASMEVLCVDRTGTLTQNRLMVRCRCPLPGGDRMSCSGQRPPVVHQRRTPWTGRFSVNWRSAPCGR